MRIQEMTVALLCTAMLAGCYGTKAPPPLRASTPPPGLGAALARPIAVPPDLPGLLDVYRHALIERAHHIPRAQAEEYAELEIASLTSRYSGRDQELRTEVTRRLQRIPAHSSTQAGQSGR